MQMRHDNTGKQYLFKCALSVVHVFILGMVIWSLTVYAVSAQCPQDHPVECRDDNGDLYGCCASDFPVCCYSDLYEDGWCCDSGTICGEYYECLPVGTTSTTSTAPGTSTTSTTVSGGETTTTTTAGGGVAGNFLAVVNINGDAENDSPESSGTLPGTSPSKKRPMLLDEYGRKLPLVIKDRFSPPLDMALFEGARKSAKEKLSSYENLMAAMYNEGEQEGFWVKDDNDMLWRQVTATNKRTGDHSYIFVDDTLSLTDATLDLYVTEFEIMYDVVAENIGVFSDRDGNGKVTILLYDMHDDGSADTGYLGGYFWMKDYLDDSVTQSQGIRSNEMDIIYIRGDEPTGWAQTGENFYNYNLTTLVHEYQHLVHFGIKVWTQGSNGHPSDIWIDEMMAMASETMYFNRKIKNNPSYSHPSMQEGGYLADRIVYYNNDPDSSIRNGHGLTYWNNQNVFPNYSLSYVFGQYLAIQATAGQGIFKQILNYMIAQGVHDYRGVVGAATQNINGIATWEDIIRSFYIANMANEPSGPYGYRGNFILTPHGPTSDRVSIHNSGAVYRQINGPWDVPPDAGSNVKFYEFEAEEHQTPTTTTTPGDTTTTVSDVCTNPDYPVDCGNGYCCPEDAPYCGSGRKKGKCFSEPPHSGPCPGTLVSDNDLEKMTLLRDFRDKVLLSTPSGQRYVSLFYENSRELTELLLSEPEILEASEDLLNDFLPDIKSIVEGNKVTVNTEQTDKIVQLCNAIEKIATPELRSTLHWVERDLRDGRMFRRLKIVPIGTRE